MIYAVIDTNVFVSAYLTHNLSSATFKVVNRLLEGKIKILYNEEIMDEYKEVLARKHFQITEKELHTLFDFIYNNGIFAESSPYLGIFSDESDRKFYEVSLSKDGSFLVTGNLKHFPKTPQVVTPAEMLQILEQETAS